MRYSLAADAGTQGLQQSSFGPVLLYSIILHVVVFVVIPLASRYFSSSVTFDRPQTFQMVSLPQQPQAARRAEPKVNQTAEKRAEQPKDKTLVPKADRKPVTDAAEPEENVDELASLLENPALPAVDVSVGSSNFRYGWYINTIRSKVEQNWKPPIDYPDAYVVVDFTILSDGSISEPEISRSSGIATLDNLALRAIKLAAPFGKLPPGYPDPSVQLEYTMRCARK